jgi:BolA family transcriptional regulator, general stress-responsive regulator
VTGDRINRIQEYLRSEFQPQELDIRDDSHQHAGHEGAKEGKGHFFVRIVSEKFRDTRPIDRHRMVYQALGPMMDTDIHALSVAALPPAPPPNSNIDTKG